MSQNPNWGNGPDNIRNRSYFPSLLVDGMSLPTDTVVSPRTDERGPILGQGSILGPPQEPARGQ